MFNNVKLGIAPIGWTNDDMPDLGSENTFEQCVSEMALAGFTGSEVGSHYPTDPEVLKKAGYQTCHIGKWHVTENPLQNGMDINIAGNHIGHPKSYFSPYGMEIWKNGPEGEFLMIGYFFRVGCFWHKNFQILCYSWWMIWE